MPTMVTKVKEGQILAKSPKSPRTPRVPKNIKPTKVIKSDNNLKISDSIESPAEQLDKIGQVIKEPLGQLINQFVNYPNEPLNKVEPPVEIEKPIKQLIKKPIKVEALIDESTAQLIKEPVAIGQLAEQSTFKKDVRRSRKPKTTQEPLLPMEEIILKSNTAIVSEQLKVPSVEVDPVTELFTEPHIEPESIIEPINTVIEPITESIIHETQHESNIEMESTLPEIITTFEIDEFRTLMNSTLAKSTCTAEMRKGMIVALETVLYKTNRYNGTRPLTMHEVPIGHRPGVNIDPATGNILENPATRDVNIDKTRVEYL
jgi:hypothetical protein